MVVDEESKEIINKQRQRIKELESRQQETGGFGEYVASTRFYANVPKDPYSHQFQLLQRPHKDLKDFGDLLDADVLLSNIQDNRTMLLVQRDYHFLNRFFDMGNRSQGIKSLFNVLYNSWRGQMRMTSALRGKERDLQSFLEPEDFTPGFSFPWKKAKKKKKKPVDYLTPDQDSVYG